ncbi:hypothetical protein [Streptomyces olivochromogenes]|uniref:hypothetical protein n=1 Tax=Streptomyces olivochromogenes TaxID=1963 RepID=UPI001F3D96C4|nr:hypothetical protein [Streptomyces olivochromogenes]MCF3133289.1 hypothetical protein [Streptomyces olivochromogenes]
MSEIHPLRFVREVFAPFGCVVGVGAVNATGTWSLADVSVGAFLDSRRADVDRVFAGICSVCGFGDGALALVDGTGYFRDYAVSSADLLLWSRGITGVPDPIARLEEPPTVRRMCRMAADVQLVDFLAELLGVAVAAGPEAREGAPQVAEILRIASDLADPTGRSAPDQVFRMWRVACLPRVLEPRGGASETGRAGFRAYDEALEELLSAPVHPARPVQ